MMLEDQKYYLLAAPLWIIAAALISDWPSWICIALAAGMVLIVFLREWREFFSDKRDSEGK